MGWICCLLDKSFKMYSIFNKKRLYFKYFAHVFILVFEYYFHIGINNYKN